MQAKDSLRDQRIRKSQMLRDKGENPYPYKYERTHTAQELQEKYHQLASDEITDDDVQVAGRIMALRNSGMFIVIDDAAARIQIFTHKDQVDPNIMDTLQLVDVGDWIGVKGKIRRTKRGELTVNTEKLEILSKTLRSLPEKYHGLTDIEMRYRQRYLDLIMNEESRQRLRVRSLILHKLREFLTQRGFMEVETPMLHSIAGGAAAKPFLTHHNSLDMPMYLRIAPELHLKQLIVGGLWDKVFEINRCFRNEGLSPRHNPEFTTLELYEAFADYHDMVQLTEELVCFLCRAVHAKEEVEYQGKHISFAAPWPRKSMVTLVQEKTGIDFHTIKSDQEAREQAKALGVEVDKEDTWGVVVEKIFGVTVEDTLIQPIHVTDFPRDISPLAKAHREDPRLTERFESYVNGTEIANAFSELTDPIDQRERFEIQAAKKDRDSEAHPMDEGFIVALEYGLPPTGGLGIGLDRLVMLLTNAASIRDVIAFPTLRKVD